VKRLVTPIENSKRNLTTDNWYTSIPLADYLLQKKITLTGTLKKKTCEKYLQNFYQRKKKKLVRACSGFKKIKH